MAIDPGLFRDRDPFRKDVSTFLDSLRATQPMDPDMPVLVVGDPERIALAKISASGIEIPANMRAGIRELAQAAGAPWLLEREDA